MADVSESRWVYLRACTSGRFGHRNFSSSADLVEIVKISVSSLRTLYTHFLHS